jgi:transposase
MRQLSVAERRYQAVLGVISDGRTVCDVAAQWHVDGRTAHRWLARYEAEGHDASGASRVRRARSDQAGLYAGLCETGHPHRLIPTRANSQDSRPLVALFESLQLETASLSGHFEQRQERPPRADGVAILLCHRLDDLVDMVQVVDHPGRE